MSIKVEKYRVFKKKNTSTCKDMALGTIFKLLFPVMKKISKTQAQRFYFNFGKARHQLSVYFLNKSFL